MTETTQNPAADLKEALRSNDLYYQAFKQQLSLTIRTELKRLFYNDSLKLADDKMLRYADTIAERFVIKIADIAPAEARQHIKFEDPNDISNIPALTESEMQATQLEVVHPFSIKEAAAILLEQMAPDYKDQLIKDKVSCEDFVSVNRDWGGKQVRNQWWLWWTVEAAANMRSLPREKPVIVKIFNAKGITSPTDMSDIIYRTLYWMVKGIQLQDDITPEYLDWLDKGIY